jgi:integrase
VADAVREHHAALPSSEDTLFPIFRVKEIYRNRWVKYEKDAEGNDKLDPFGDKIVKTDRFGRPVPKKRKLSVERLQTERAHRLLGKLVRKTEFELMNGWHCLRHSFISICVARGWSWQQIAEYVGHVSPETTRLYTHFNLEESRKRIESLAIKF